MVHVAEGNFPCTVDSCAVLSILFWCERLPALVGAMAWNRHYSGRTIGNRNTGLCECNLHHVTGEVARRMHHALVARRDFAESGIVVHAEVGGHETSPCRSDECGQR